MTTPPTCDCPEPDARTRGGLSRRAFLRASTAVGALAALSGPLMSTRLAFATAGLPYTGDVLVVISLRGGFDGLSAIVPAGDPAYYAARPNIAVPAAQLLDRGTMFGLHPALAPLLPYWRAGTFGAVHAVGQTDATRSHFSSLEEMERAAPGTSLRTGWLDRTLGVRGGGSTFQAAVLGSTMISQSLSGPTREIAMVDIDSFRLDGDPTINARRAQALQTVYAAAPTNMAAPASTALGALTTTAAIKAGGNVTGNGAVYPTTPLAKALREVSRLIKASAGLQIACVDYDDWDMHIGLGKPAAGGAMNDHLATLAGAMAAFAQDLGSLMSRVTVVTLSEFGRRLAENGSGGTDHGHGNAVLLLGGGVVGGKVHGPWPGLAPAALDSGDLRGQTDYRDVLGEVLQKRCRIDSLSTVFPGFAAAPLGVVRQRP